VNVVGTELMETFNSTLPQGITLQNLIFSPGSISFNGVSDTRISIAELYHNLLALDIFSEVNIGTISEAENTEESITAPRSYAFDIQCSLKGGVSQ